jgi:hypothetical protein
MVVPAEKAPVVTSSKAVSPFPDLWNPPLTADEREQMAVNKTLYHKLQNVEDHPGETMPLHQLTFRIHLLSDPTVRGHRRVPLTSSAIV